MGNQLYQAGLREVSKASQCLSSSWLALPGLEFEDPSPSVVMQVWNPLFEVCYCNLAANIPERRRPEEEVSGPVSGSIVGLGPIVVRELECVYSLGGSGYRPARLSGSSRFGLLERPRGSLSRQSVSLCRPGQRPFRQRVIGTQSCRRELAKQVEPACTMAKSRASRASLCRFS